MRDHNLSVLGSTGSIGTQTLDVARRLQVPVCGLAAHSNIELLERQIREFRPVCAAVLQEEKAAELKERVRDLPTKILSGIDGVCAVATLPQATLVFTAIVGIAGLIPTLEAIRENKSLALANKETLVAGGSLVIPEVQRRGLELIPVDSEHSAIFQSLLGAKRPREELRKILLTASGGPFYGKTRQELSAVRREDALRHPNWSMGAKITVDSATLMNKGLEMIEAMWLFGVGMDQIEVVVHRESIIHSMVEFCDHAIIAQLGLPDMRVPIQFAITCPEREQTPGPGVDFAALGSLSFGRPDLETFRCLSHCIRAARMGGTMPAAVNGANEMAVSLFLRGKIDFLQIDELVGAVLDAHSPIETPTLRQILDADEWAREYVLTQYQVR
ncbi:1-deoxy-D-xylulose-5-phosphate reductoisomerase [Feifania hominis]|uniref:1-deoxy-D-xylulose 5-phosphate reductoisomerase n=1 Tax=Feifania hominis TaxID=2763660 RepID=A0A926DD49_9FIRM|nr:1-deoxy-D-xylulose-5-phosphate reductoisomerase [Feifania hominis]MBC8535646.1 1-deoxy-D-xylulose-5-phosphate reductoisomerase [Feifania hominis]